MTKANELEPNNKEMLMRLYTCCPEKECGAHAEALAFLRSWGVEPALEFDETEGRHYLEFDVPQGSNRRPFVNAMYRKTNGGVLCYCGYWDEPDAKGNAYRVLCESCQREFSVCIVCAGEGTCGCPWCNEPLERENEHVRT